MCAYYVCRCVSQSPINYAECFVCGQLLPVGQDAKDGVIVSCALNEGMKVGHLRRTGAARDPSAGIYQCQGCIVVAALAGQSQWRITTAVCLV